MFKGCLTVGLKGWPIGCKGPLSSQVPLFAAHSAKARS